MGDTGGADQNLTATFTVAPSCTAATVATQPTSQSITYGANPSFSATASGSPAPTVQWQVSTNSGSTWTNLSGATSSPLNLTKPGVALSGNQYRAVFTNTCSGTQTATTNAAPLNVSPKNLTIAGASAQNKAYDGSTNAIVSFAGATLSGVVSGDTVSINTAGYNAAFGNKNVGTGKSVSVTGVALTGADAGNYSLTQPSGLVANVTAKSITRVVHAANKAYDGTTAASVLTRSLTGVVTGDIVSLSGGTATFGSKNVGTGKTVTLSGATLTGTDAGNYNLTSVGTTTADIATIAVSGSFTASDKVYDGTTVATVTGRSLTGVLAGDVVSLSGGAATFGDKNVGTGKTVTLSGAVLAGADKDNYTVTGVSTTTADVTANSISGSFTASDKAYDGTTAATVLTRSLNGDVAGDEVSLSGWDGVVRFQERGHRQDGGPVGGDSGWWGCRQLQPVLGGHDDR